jgi:murein DD-endopeptidase MepM/ murein hydrolase activator NlpD
VEHRYRGYGTLPSGRRAAGRWLVAALLTALLAGLRYLPVPALAPARAAVGRAATASNWPAGALPWAEGLWHKAARLWRWPPLSGGVRVVPPPRRRYALAMPVAGVVIAPYGPGVDPLTAKRAVLPGILVRTAPEAVVRAPAAARVATVQPSPPAGESVTLAVAGEVTTTIVGLDPVTVRPGETVRQGEVLGRVATAPAGSVPHVMVVVTVDGRTGDPLSPLYYGPAE